jgi:hypothetical protein
MTGDQSVAVDWERALLDQQMTRMVAETLARAEAKEVAGRQGSDDPRFVLGHQCHSTAQPRCRFPARRISN